MRIERIHNGIVMDHINVGKGIEILNLFPTELLKTKIDYASYVDSVSLGSKDIIKIENLDVDPKTLMKMALIAPDITISIIRDGEIQEKLSPTVPPEVEGVISCKNPKCVTLKETYLVSRFRIKRMENGKLQQQCMFCEHMAYS